MQIALLCVQESPADRPSMLEISRMLRDGTSDIPSPKKPAFSIRKVRDGADTKVDSSLEEIYSVNDTTISELFPR